MIHESSCPVSLEPLAHTVVQRIVPAAPDLNSGG